MASFPDQLVVIGSDDVCAYVARLWSQGRGETRSFEPSQAGDAMLAAGSNTLFGAAPAIVCRDVAKWKKADVDATVGLADRFLLCVITEKAGSASKTRWEKIAAVVVGDKRFVNQALVDVFTAEGVSLDRHAKTLIVERGIDLGKARSMAVAASLSGITQLDDRKTRILLGSAGAEARLFDVIDALFDGLTGAAFAGCEAVEPVVFAQFAAEEIRRLLVLRDAGVGGKAGAALVGAPPFAAAKLDRRVRRFGSKLEELMTAAARLDGGARAGMVDSATVVATLAVILAA